MSDYLRPHGLRHFRLSCHSLFPGICSNSCPLSQWRHTTILSSITPFSSCLQPFPASGSFPVSWLFASGGQIVGSFSFSISPPNEYQGWFPLGLTGLISLLSKGDSCCLQSLFQHNSSKASILQCSAFMVQLSPPYMTTGKTIALTRWTFVNKVMCLLFYAV